VSRLVVVTAVGVAVWAALAWVSLSAARCNWRQFREDRDRAPLDGLAGVDSFQPLEAPTPPRNWPPAGRTRSASEAEAYATLADERGSGLQLGGELTILFAGSVLGALLPLVWGNEWARYSVPVPFLIAATGFLLRRRSDATYEPLVEHYRSRALELARTARPSRPIARPRRPPAGRRQPAWYRRRIARSNNGRQPDIELTDDPGRHTLPPAVTPRVGGAYGSAIRRWIRSAMAGD
jgi:hypothetical protein